MKTVAYFVLYILLPVLSFSAPLNELPPAITGTVTTADNKPAAYVSVTLKGTGKGAITDEAGSYRIAGIKPGVYTIVASFAGIERTEQSVEVKANETITVNLMLKTDARQLEEVMVVAGGQRYQKGSSSQLNRVPLSYMEDPQTYSVATKQLIRDQGATDFQSALRTIPAASGASRNGYDFSGVYLRGFRTGVNFHNGLYVNNFSGGDPQVVKRIEALRGPAGTLFGTGGASYGGILNKVTKQPFGNRVYEFGFSAGSNSLNRVTADINTPLDKEQKALFRLNMAYQSEANWQDNSVKSTTLLFAPVLTYAFSDRLSMKLELELNSNKKPSSWYFGTAGLDETPRNVKDLGMDYNRYYADKGFTHDPVQQNMYAFQLNYKLSEAWDLSFDALRNDAIQKNGAVFPFFVSGGLMARDFYDFDFQWNVTTLQPNIRGRFTTGSLSHRFLAGINYQHYRIDNSGGYSDGGYDTVDLNTSYVPIANVGAFRASYPYTFGGYNANYSLGFYMLDVVNISRRLNLLLSARYDRYQDLTGGFVDIVTNARGEKWGQGFVSPKIGATYQVVPGSVTVFANFSTGFTNVAPTADQTFKPETSVQYEGGLKFDVLRNRLSATVSYYDIKVKNTVRANPVNPLISVQDGTRLSRGADLELTAEPVSGWNIIAGFGYNDSKYEKADINVEGKRPGGVSKNNANAWTTYTLPSGKIKGLGLGMGFNYSSQLFFNDVNTLSIPSYTVANAALFYNRDKYRLSVNVNNIADKQYWDYSGLPQRPLSVLGSVTIRL